MIHNTQSISKLIELKAYYNSLSPLQRFFHIPSKLGQKLDNNVSMLEVFKLADRTLLKKFTTPYMCTWALLNSCGYLSGYAAQANFSSIREHLDIECLYIVLTRLQQAGLLTQSVLPVSLREINFIYFHLGVDRVFAYFL